MDEGPNPFEALQYGYSTNPQVKQHRKYKRVAITFLLFLILGFIYTLYEIMTSIFSVSTSKLMLIFHFFDDAIFLVAVVKSFFDLAVPFKTHLRYFLGISVIVSAIRLYIDPDRYTILRALYLCVMAIVIHLIDKMLGRLSQLAQMLKPDDDDPDTRFTV